MPVVAISSFLEESWLTAADDESTFYLLL